MANKKRREPSFETFDLFKKVCEELGMKDDPGEQTQGSGRTTLGMRRALHNLSFSQIAKRLNIAASTVTACVKTLEGLLGVSDDSESGQEEGKPRRDSERALFKTTQRDGRKTLTELGIECYTRVCEMLRLQESFGAKPVPRRDLVTIGSFNALLASHIPLALQPFLELKDFRERPLIRLPEYDSPEIFEAVGYGKVDFAIGSMPTSRDKAIADATVELVPLGHAIERGLICHRDHELAAKETVTAKDLTKERIFRFPARATSPGLDTWLAPDSEAGGDVVEVMTFGVMLQFVKLNLGVALVANLPGEIQDAVDDGKGKVHYKSLHGIESAVVAAYLPKGGTDCLSRGARKIYDGIAEYFLRLAESQKPKGRANRDRSSRKPS